MTRAVGTEGQGHIGTGQDLALLPPGPGIQPGGAALWARTLQIPCSI